MMKNKDLPASTYLYAANTIKEAILSAQYEAARGVNNIQLMLYYAIGRYISANTRKKNWGTGALTEISRLLKEDMPGLRGYSVSNLKLMRTFYEAWSDLDANSPVKTDDLDSQTISPVKTDKFNSPFQSGEFHVSIISDENRYFAI